MREIVEAMIEKLDYFGIECDYLKEDAYAELEVNEFHRQSVSLGSNKEHGGTTRAIHSLILYRSSKED